MTVQTESNADSPRSATPEFRADIPLDFAIRAYHGISHSPERRGESEVSGYAQTLTADLAEFTALAEKYGTSDAFADLFPRYRDAYKRSTLAHLSAKSRCISSMITGPSGFPVRRAEKANATEHRRLQDVLNCRALWRKRILKAIVPNTDGPIMSSDSDACERLSEEVKKAEELQAFMKEVNKTIRKHLKADPAAQVAALVALGISAARAKLLLTPDCMNDIGFPHYKLTNNGANIRRLKARLAVVEKSHATPATEQEGTHARLADCPAETVSACSIRASRMRTPAPRSKAPASAGLPRWDAGKHTATTGPFPWPAILRGWRAET